MDSNEDYDSEISDYSSDEHYIVEAPHNDQDLFDEPEAWSDIMTDDLDSLDNGVERTMDNVPVPTENTFDVSLPATHSYLGQNLEELRGRTILDDGIYMNLPLLIKQSLLFPGQTLPMTVFGAQIIDMLQMCIQNNHTFGVVSYDYPEMEQQIGTTAEIYEYTDSSLDYGRREFRLKAKGRQRFKILNLMAQDLNKVSAQVKILPEITLGPPFLDQRLASLDRLRVFPDSEEASKRKQKRVENWDAAVTAWPAWVYRQYDPKRLSSKIRQHLQFLEIRGGSVPKDPIDLSFWVAQNIVVDHDERLTLLSYDCAISRLQREIKYLMEDKIYECVNCESLIGRQSHMFPMNKEGPQGTYVNPGGVLHETITFYHVVGVMLNDASPSTEYSWFPGYAWTIATCKGCRRHVGWKFTAVQDDLKPKRFWGLIRRSLKNRDLRKDNKQ